MTTYPTIPLKEIEIEERPQVRLLRFGAYALSESELLAMVLRSYTQNLKDHLHRATALHDNWEETNRPNAKRIQQFSRK